MKFFAIVLTACIELVLYTAVKEWSRTLKGIAEKVP